MCAILGRGMQKTCTSCGQKCHISHGKCSKCKTKFISKKEATRVTIKTTMEAHVSNMERTNVEGLQVFPVNEN